MIKSLDPNKIKTNEKSYENFLIYYGYGDYVTVKYLRYVKNNNENSLYFFINNINGDIEENNGNKYLMLVPTNESKIIMKKYKEL